MKRAEPRDSKSQTPGPPGASQWGSRIMPSAANGWAGQPPPTWQQGYGPQGTAHPSHLTALGPSWCSQVYLPHSRSKFPPFHSFLRFLCCFPQKSVLLAEGGASSGTCPRCVSPVPFGAASPHMESPWLGGAHRRGWGRLQLWSEFCTRPQ